MSTETIRFIRDGQLRTWCLMSTETIRFIRDGQLRNCCFMDLYTLGGSGGVVNSLDICLVSLKSHITVSLFYIYIYIYIYIYLSLSIYIYIYIYMAAFTSGAYFEFANFTLPTLKTFLEARSQNFWRPVHNLLLVPPNDFFSTNSPLSSGQPKKDAKTLFSHPPSPFPGNFYNCSSGGIYTASQL